jgi:formimidoylglutamase
VKTSPAPQSVFSKGRDGDPRLGEWAQSIAIEEIHRSKQPTFVLLGAPDDLGVRLNRGRPGAKNGPDAIRSAFYKFAFPRSKAFDGTRWLDVGNIDVSEQILVTHEMAYNAASIASACGATLIALGGGHDFAAPHIMGCFSGWKTNEGTSRFGVINVDPHLDVREFENHLPHSGTPFRQILESGMVKGKNLVQFGAREGRNARAHFDYCKTHKVNVLEFWNIRKKGDAVKQFGSALSNLSKEAQKIALTIDMDSCADMEGVSAAPVIGFSAWELCQFAYKAGANKKVAMLELAEVAPDLDPTGRSQRIAAEVIFHFLIGRLETL